MTCFKCRRECGLEEDIKKKETWRCKIGLHRLDRTKCEHEEGYRICLDCTRYIFNTNDYGM